MIEDGCGRPPRELETGMGEERSQVERKRARRGGVIAAACVAFVAAMVGAAYASVPLYAAFCSLTGYGGATRVGEAANAPKAVGERSFTIRFDANVAPGLPWTFKPVERQITLKAGETRMVFYKVENTSGAATSANATYNVMPAQAGGYFVKLQCFCFEEQTLAPHESLEMPVVFYIDPDISTEPDLNGVETITLSYTFFPAKDQPKPVARAEGEGRAGGG